MPAKKTTAKKPAAKKPVAEKKSAAKERTFPTSVDDSVVMQQLAKERIGEDA